LGTDVRHISIWQIKPDGAKSIVYFRYLFDTDDDDETQIIGGDIMILASKEIADATSTATRGFIMKYVDSSYEFQFCLPNKEECDPTSQINFNRMFIICFACSFSFEIIVFVAYWFLTRKRREREYEERVAEQRRILKEMNEKDDTKNVTRIGMRDVCRKRAKKIASDKSEFADLQKEKNKNRIVLDAEDSVSKEDKTEWETYDTDKTRQQTEMAILDPNTQFANRGDSVYEDDKQTLLPDGWEEHTDNQGQTYYYDTINGESHWDLPQ